MPRLKLVDATGRFIIPVVVDTREQQPYPFADMLCDSADGGGPLTVPTVRGTLASGDYSLLGYETRVAVERKSLADLYGTLGQGRERFERELVRLAGMEWAAVVIEATWPELCSEPPAHTSLPPKTVFRSILAWSVRYPRVHWFPAGPRRLAEVTTFRLLERFVKEDQAEKERHKEKEREEGASDQPPKELADISAAAQQLKYLYAASPWFQMVGVAGGRDQLVVYCKEKPPKRDTPPKDWQGYAVKVVVIGEVTPAGKVGGT